MMPGRQYRVRLTGLVRLDVHLTQGEKEASLGVTGAKKNSRVYYLFLSWSSGLALRDLLPGALGLGYEDALYLLRR